MRFIAFAALAAAPLLTTSGRAQGPGPWRMHDPLDWGMWLGLLVLVGLVALAIAGAVAVARWIGGRRIGRARTAREVLDERYVRGEIGREEYLRRRDDIAGHS